MIPRYAKILKAEGKWLFWARRFLSSLTLLTRFQPIILVSLWAFVNSRICISWGIVYWVHFGLTSVYWSPGVCLGLGLDPCSMPTLWELVPWARRDSWRDEGEPLENRRLSHSLPGMNSLFRPSGGMGEAGQLVWAPECSSLCSHHPSLLCCEL